MREQLRRVKESIGSLPDISGQTVRHKTFGKGVVQSCSEGRLAVSFPEKGAPFAGLYAADKENCVLKGFIIPDNDRIVETIRSVFDRKDEVKRLEAQLSAAEKELKNLPKK